MGLEDFDLIKLNDEEDIREALESNGRVFSIWKKRLFCTDIYRELLVEWVEDHWEERSFDTLGEKGNEPVEDEDAFRFTNGVKPWSEFHRILDRKAAEEEVSREEQIANCKRKVIGWTTRPAYNGTFFLRYIPSEEEYIAIIADIRAHGYLFTGEDHQEGVKPVCPVLDNYLYCSLSRHEFSEMMAEAHGDFAEFAYAKYAQSCLIDDDKKVFPPEEKTIKGENPPHEFQLPEEFFDGFVEHNQNVNPSYICLPLGKGYYWIGDKITLRCGEKQWQGEIVGLHYYESIGDIELKYGCTDYDIPFRQEDIQGAYPRLFALVKDDDEKRNKPLYRFFYDNKDKILYCSAPSSVFYRFVNKKKAWEVVPYDEVSFTDLFQGAWGFFDSEPYRFLIVGKSVETVTDERFVEAVSLFDK